MSSKSSKKPRGRSRRSCIACAGGIGESGSTTRILPQLRKALATFDRRAALEAFDPSVVRIVNIARNSQAAVLKQMETLRPAFAPGEPPRSPEEELGHLAQRSGLGVAYVLLSPVVALGILGVPFLPVELRMALAPCG